MEPFDPFNVDESKKSCPEAYDNLLGLYKQALADIAELNAELVECHILANIGG